MEQPHKESDSSVSNESIFLLDNDSVFSAKPILAKGPVIQFIPIKDNLISKGHGSNCAQFKGAGNNSTIKPNYSDLQMITTKVDFDKISEKIKTNIESNSESLIDTSKNLNEISSKIEFHDTKRNYDTGLTQLNCEEHNCDPIVSSSMNVEDESCITDLNKSNVHGGLPKLKSVKETKISKIDTLPTIKSKSKDSVLPHVKNKFNPGSLQFIKQAINGVIFSGWIGEREYVEKLKGYRDKIAVDEWEETFNQKLRTIVNNISGVKEQTKWINITAPCESLCYHLWVLLDSAPFPGHYWFQIDDVIVDNQFGLKVIMKILRQIHTFDGESFSEHEKRMNRDINISSEEWKNWLLTFTNVKSHDVLTSLLAVFTPSNLSSLFRLIVVLCVTLVVACAKFLQESWHFLLKLLRELGIFVHHATPFLQSLLNFIEKLIGGFYILLAMLYRDLRRPSPPPPPFESRHLPIGPPGNHTKFPLPRESAQSLKYVPPQSWVYKND